MFRLIYYENLLKRQIKIFLGFLYLRSKCLITAQYVPKDEHMSSLPLHKSASRVKLNQLFPIYTAVIKAKLLRKLFNQPVSCFLIRKIEILHIFFR